MKTFQKPLTSEDEKEYLIRYQRGDQTARNILIERNLRLVAHVVKKYQGIHEDSDDLISIGTIGLIKAVSTFDFEKSKRLSTYAARCIENEILMYIRSKKKHAKEVSLYEPIGTDKEGNEIQLLDVMESPPKDIITEYAARMDIQKLFSLFQFLPKREYEVLIYRYGLFGFSALTQKEIALRLHISRSYVSRIEKKAIQRLQVLFFSQNLDDKKSPQA